MASSYVENLINQVTLNSVNKQWSDAVLEWEIENWDEDIQAETSCLCGKKDIRYLFTIKNQRNGHVLEPIGSSCIKKFERSDLNNKTAIHEKLFKLYHAIEENQFIELSSEFFSRRVIEYLHEEKVFESTYNSFDGNRDFHFMLDMFNKRSKPTDRQSSKIKAIIVNQIKPYLKEQVKK